MRLLGLRKYVRTMSKPYPEGRFWDMIFGALHNKAVVPFHSQVAGAHWAWPSDLLTSGD